MKPHIANGDGQSAILSATEARTLYNELGNLPGEALAERRLADQQLAEHNFDEALANAKRALIKCQRAKDALGEVATQITLTKVHTAMGEPERAPFRKEA